MMPRNVSSMAIAVHTPVRPMLKTDVSVKASVRRTPHIEARFIKAGMSVSPAPTQQP